MNENYSCVDKIKKSNLPCEEMSCRHSLKSSKNLNCSIIAAEKGPMTLQEIGDFYGISRMRICQIEKAILKKLKSSSKKLSDFDPSSG
tara:strand:+ start:192 stop:455 length:264 start_codon:yes stop_codon:yes gene_type:complete